MTCIDLPELTDLQLAMYLDDEADEDIRDHVTRCSYCRERAKQIAQEQNGLRVSLHRLSCPDSDTLRDFEFGLLSIREAGDVERHLRVCPHCTHDIAALRAYIADMPWEETDDATEAVGTVQRIRWFVAELVPGGAGLAPIYAGVRGTTSETSSLYVSGDTRIDTTALVDAQIPETRVLIGSILGPDTENAGPESRWRVDLWHGQELLATETLDDLCSFRFSGLFPGEYELIINGPGTKVRVPHVTVA